MSLTLTGIDDLKKLAVDKIQAPVSKDVVPLARLNQNLSKRQQTRAVSWKPWTAGSAWAALGINGSLIPVSEGAHRDYAFAMQIPVPLASIVGKYALLMSVSVRTFPLCPMTFKILDGSSLAVARVLDIEHPFLKACDQGDLIAVRTMLGTGEGRPSDVSSDSWSPLTVSIVYTT